MVDELRERGVGIATVAATSARNKVFVESLGSYDEVLTYDAIGSATVTSPAVLIDFTGAARVLGAVYQHFAPSLLSGVLIGLTHRNPRTRRRPGCRTRSPEFFFTPAVEDQAIAAEGEDAYFAQYHAAETRFLQRMASWLTIRHGQGPWIWPRRSAVRSSASSRRTRDAS